MCLHQWRGEVGGVYRGARLFEVWARELHPGAAAGAPERSAAAGRFFGDWQRGRGLHLRRRGVLSLVPRHEVCVGVYIHYMCILYVLR
jgi:hypothetical protein